MNYKEAVEKFHVFLNSINGDITNIKISEDKWSLREILGHLIDSASNNHQRFVRLQFSDLMDFPAYEAEQWIRVQNYNSMNWELLVSLWYNYNCMLINLIEGIESDKLQNVWIKNEEAIPLEEIINHYYKHLEMHIEHFHNRLGELTI
jgi:DNA-directed RNA polymerase delta subunit